MQKKIQRAVLSLYAVAGIQILTLVWQCLLLGRFHAFEVKLAAPTLTGASYLASLGPSIFWTLCICLAVYKTAEKLKSEEPWAWAAAVCIFFVAIPSYGILASVVGLLSLFDREVREPFIKALDIQL